MEGYTEAEAKYTLTSAGSKIEMICKFRNNFLFYCSLNVLASSLIYAQSQPANVLDAAKGFLQRYQTYSGASYIQTMRDMLDKVTELKPMATTSGNVKLKISTDEYYATFEWIYTVNGLDIN